tara:strand:+ start:330 stop:647 length:318 start_codon:yes stop_codon:yes gene_type:complete
METKFTKGPWTVRDFGPHDNNSELTRLEINYGIDQECICDTVYELPDAHLIAAAPELYEELTEAAAGMTVILDEYRDKIRPHWVVSMEEDIARFSAVLAKARGEL